MILDATCGNRMMWFDKQHKDCIYMDIRKEVLPDLVADFRALPFRDKIFDLIVFDPPHQPFLNGYGIFVRKFGALQSKTIHIDLYKAAKELFRVLKCNGILIVKWNTHDYRLEKLLQLFPERPLFGQKTAFRTKHASSTYWLTFRKECEV
jgi:SAM-dependent methyltransferase